MYTLSLAGRWIATKIFNLSCSSEGSKNFSLQRRLFLKIRSNGDFFLKMRSNEDLLPMENSIFAKLSIFTSVLSGKSLKVLWTSYLFFPWKTPRYKTRGQLDQLNLFYKRFNYFNFCLGRWKDEWSLNLFIYLHSLLNLSHQRFPTGSAWIVTYRSI